jgi:two-component system CheB/CheR fusion protein
MPYRTATNVINGVVITFVDITASKDLESRLRKP